MGKPQFTITGFILHRQVCGFLYDATGSATLELPARTNPTPLVPGSCLDISALIFSLRLAPGSPLLEQGTGLGSDAVLSRIRRKESTLIALEARERRRRFLSGKVSENEDCLNRLEDREPRLLTNRLKVSSRVISRLIT